MEREQNRKTGTVSKMQLLSCYAASVLIVLLCVVEAMKPETANPMMYYGLAVLGVFFSVYITVRNNAAKKQDVPRGNRLK